LVWQVALGVGVVHAAPPSDTPVAAAQPAKPRQPAPPPAPRPAPRLPVGYRSARRATAADADASRGAPDGSPYLHALEHCERDPSRALDMRTARLFERIGPLVLSKVLIVTVPDPVDSSFGEQFDTTLSAVGAAFAAMGYASGEYALPWTDQRTSATVATDKSGGTASDTPSGRCVPGVLVFRRSAPGPAFDGNRSEVALVLLVGETPAWGVHVNALGQALSFAAQSATTASDRIRILGPSFSGSASSLRAALDQWSAAQSARAPTFEIISGSATAPATATELRAPNTDFSATVVPDNVQTCAMYRFLAQRLSVPMEHVALMVESNTAFGDFFKAFQCAREKAGPTDPPLRPRIIVPFPLHVAELRAAEEKLRKPSADDQIADGRSPLDLRIDQGRQSMDSLPAFAPDLTAPGTQLELAEIFSTLCRQDVRALGLLASDVRDVAVLGEEAKRQCPGLTLFTLGPDRMLHHRRYRDLDGLLVASSYPLHASAAGWSYPYRGREVLQTFPSEGAQGVFNAALLLAGETSKLLDYGPPPGVDDRTVVRPPVWISALGRDGFWPITAAAYGAGDHGYVRAIDEPAATGGKEPTFRLPLVHALGTAIPSETKVRRLRAWALRFSLPAGFVFLMAMAQLFSLINLVGFVVQSRPNAAPSRRRSLWGWLDPYRAVPRSHMVQRRIAVAWTLSVLLLVNLGALILCGIPSVLGTSWRMGVGAAISAVLCGTLLTAIGMLALGPVPAWSGDETETSRVSVDSTFVVALLLGGAVVGALLVALMRPWLLSLERHEPDLTFFYERATNITSGLSPATGAMLFAMALLAAGIGELNRIRLNAFAAQFQRICFGLWDDPTCKMTAAVRTGPLALVIIAVFTAVGILTGTNDYHHPFEGPWLGYLFTLPGPYLIAGMITFQLYRFARVWVTMHRVFRAYAERRNIPDFKAIVQPYFLHLLQPPFDPTLGRVIIDQVAATRAGEARADEAPLRLMLFASYGRAHLHNFLTFVTISGLLLILLSTAYPFKLLHSTDVLTWVMITVILAVGLFVLIEMNRDEVLSEIGGTAPRRVSLDRTFNRTVLIHVGLPLLGLAATRFTTVGLLVGDFVKPLLQLFSI
jgi:hypothetical protein